jgi:hypothetical protein
VRELADQETSILLKDKLLNTTQDLTANPSYTFQSEIASTSDRFSLLLQKVATNLDPVQQRSFEAFCSEGKRIQVLLHGLDETQAQITVYDTMGRCITESLSTHTFQPGVYIVKVTSADFLAQKKVLVTR